MARWLRALDLNEAYRPAYIIVTIILGSYIELYHTSRAYKSAQYYFLQVTTF